MSLKEIHRNISVNFAERLQQMYIIESSTIMNSNL